MDSLYLLHTPEMIQEVDLFFVDPPFRIGFKYENFDDNMPKPEYLRWCRGWISGVYRCLKNDGSFWLHINDANVAELKIASEECGFFLRRWIISHFTFGQNQRNNFTPSHTHLLYFTKDKKKFTFNANDPVCRQPSARQLIYKDKRANPNGRLPDDVWEFSRICGTFKERNEGGHGCQISEALLARIIRLCSKPDQIVSDIMCGTGSTLVVAKKLGRQFIGCDISETYITEARKRTGLVSVGDAISGESK